MPEAGIAQPKPSKAHCPSHGTCQCWQAGQGPTDEQDGVGFGAADDCTACGAGDASEHPRSRRISAKRARIAA
jgi:hypothetical protein